MLPAGVLAMTAPESPALAVVLVAVLGVVLAWLYEVDMANLRGVRVAVVVFLLSILLKGPDEPVANGWLAAASFALMVGSILLKPARRCGAA
jgi:hypothetical protein